MLQELAWQVSVVGVAALALVFFFVFLRSGRKADYAPIQKRGYQLRTLFFGALVLVGAPTLLYSMTRLPYDAPRREGPAAQVVEVTGHQWYWTVSQNRLKAGEPVEFRVTSADVNHGFAIYDPDMRIVAQTQAMPDYVNRLRYTFTKPGVYKVMCLEYCGVAHPNMSTEFQVS